MNYNMSLIISIRLLRNKNNKKSAKIFKNKKINHKL